ncbi:MAG: CPBP family intramembrane metalloprotease [Anaerolineales bacterium]|jgi:membrane protease YdiL (CAAX protease family)
MKDSTATQSIQQHTIGKSFLLHIAPGILVTVAFLVLKPMLDSTRFPPLLAFLLAILLIDIPFMLGVMLNEGRKLNGRYSLSGIVLYREKVSWKTFTLVFIVAFVVMYLLIMLATLLSVMLAESAFSWLPKWFFLDDAAQYAGYAKNILVLVFTLQLLITGIILPWVEELYFRGYLMPRISRYEKWAPLIGGFFFGLYHVWQFFGFVGVFLLGAGLGYVVWWKKDIRLSISLHVFANALIRFSLLLGVLAS